jgi:predicted type IV restriction endonuclease
VQISLDNAYESVCRIVQDTEGRQDLIITEEDAKIQLIHRVLTEALGWNVSDIRAERQNENGYSDYILTDQDSNAFLVEAKRMGLVEIASADVKRVRQLKLSGPGLTKCQRGIEQAASYANPNGLPMAVLTDGRTWIIFKPHVDGAPYKDKKAFVFPSFEAIKADFAVFYDLLAKEQFRKKTYRIRFDQIHENRNDLFKPLVSALTEQEIRLSKKSSLAFDLEKVLSSFFSQMSAEDDPQMLIECFVESQESRIADFSLEKMTASVLGNIVSKSDVDSKLIELISKAVGTDKGETIFIVGPTGSGKSTFLDRFFEKYLDRGLREKCVLIKVNSLDFSGNKDHLIQ